MDKYLWIVPLEDKKGVTITNAFQKVLNVFNRQPNKIVSFTIDQLNNDKKCIQHIMK